MQEIAHTAHFLIYYFPGGMPPDPPRKQGTTSVHRGALIVLAGSKPTEFLNQKVGKYEQPRGFIKLGTELHNPQGFNVK